MFISQITFKLVPVAATTIITEVLIHEPNHRNCKLFFLSCTYSQTRSVFPSAQHLMKADAKHSFTLQLYCMGYCL